MIQSIQTETGTAVEVMRRGNDEVEEGIVLADRAGAALKRVVEGSDRTEDMIAQIAAASEEQSTTSEQISRAVEMISMAAGESAQGVSQIAQSTDGLNQLTEGLRTLVTRFKTNGGQPNPTANPTANPAAEPSRAAGGDGHPGAVPAFGAVNSR